MEFTLLQDRAVQRNVVEGNQTLPGRHDGARLERDRGPDVQTRREVVARPAQLLKVTEVSPGKYSFDFSDVRRFIDMGKSVGMQYFEFPHLWLYWGVREPIHVYQREGDQYKLLWPTETAPTTGVYRNFWSSSCPPFESFLMKNICRRIALTFMSPTNLLARRWTTTNERAHC